MQNNGSLLSPIHYGDAARLLRRHMPSGHEVFYIADPAVHDLYPDLFPAEKTFTLNGGEVNKTLKEAARIHRALLDAGANRSSFIVGIGGGITTDLAGHVAATYMRGIHFCLVPTTLLAQVDAAIGGKNGVNLDGYKNIVGTFARPEFIITDPAFLGTLSARDLRSGMAEVIKSAIIGDRELFELLEVHGSAIFFDPRLLCQTVERSTKVKQTIVQEDPYEAGPRKVLNLGHTFGHAIEKIEPGTSHGKAVAIGMALSAAVATHIGLLRQEDADRIISLLKSFDLSTICHADPSELTDKMTRDKKAGANRITLVLPAEIGRCVVSDFSREEVEKILNRINQR